MVLPVEAMVTPTQGRSGQVIATGGLSDLAKESVTQHQRGSEETHGEGHQGLRPTRAVPRDPQRGWDSASITMATAIISAFEGVPIDQNLAMTGSLTVRGESSRSAGLREDRGRRQVRDQEGGDTQV